MVEGKNIVKYFGCCSFKPARTAKQIAPACKNKWVENWYRYWFYHTVPMVEERGKSRKIVKHYPLAMKMGKNIFDCKLDFPSTNNSKICEKAYELTASLQSARDLCEEYIAARVWPLKKGWSVVCFHNKVVREKDYLYPDKEAFRLKKYTKDEDFVSAVEVKAVDILGKFLKKKKDLMDKILEKDYKCLNRVFEIAQIKYDERPPPAYTRAAKPSIENVTKKKRAGGQLAKRTSKKKKVLASFDPEKIAEDETWVLMLTVKRFLVSR
jgi:hypothetical protein